MRRAVLVALLGALAALGLLAPAASAATTIGIGEQNPRIFSETNWTALGLRDVRLVVSWDVNTIGFERREIDTYMAEAERTGARVLVAFGRSRIDARRKVLPSPARYRKAFRAFRKRWPYARDFVTWNEANHCSQPTCHRPERAAAYYDVLRSTCPKCTVVGGDVLDTPDMEAWVRAFRLHARHTPRIWGLHNYLDANRLTTKGTRTLLRAVKGDVWFTETGGVVKRRRRSRITFPESAKHAAKATQWVFKRLARIDPRRTKRIYLYHWVPAIEPDPQWDSAIIDHSGHPRPAYAVLRTWVGRFERSRRSR